MGVCKTAPATFGLFTPPCYFCTAVKLFNQPWFDCTANTDVCTNLLVLYRCTTDHPSLLCLYSHTAVYPIMFFSSLFSSFFGQINGANRWRVCYQPGLPRLFITILRDLKCIVRSRQVNTLKHVSGADSVKIGLKEK